MFWQLTDFIQFPSLIHIWLHSVGLQRNYVWYSKVETMQHWSWILYALFCLCHMIEDKCWKHSFKQSMRLKCTARKECIKYINKSIYLKSFVPKMINTPCRKKYSWTQKTFVDRKDPIGGIIIKLCCLKFLWMDGYANTKHCLSGIFPNGCMTFWNETLHLFFTQWHVPSLHYVWVCLCLVCPINANIFLHKEYFLSFVFLKKRNLTLEISWKILCKSLLSGARLLHWSVKQVSPVSL